MFDFIPEAIREIGALTPAVAIVVILAALAAWRLWLGYPSIFGPRKGSSDE